MVLNAAMPCVWPHLMAGDYAPANSMIVDFPALLVCYRPLATIFAGLWGHLHTWVLGGLALPGQPHRRHLPPLSLSQPRQRDHAANAGRRRDRRHLF